MAKTRRKKKPPAKSVQHLPGSIGAYVEEHCAWLLHRNYSPQTVKGRRTYLGFFVTWCTEHGLVEPSEVTKPVIERYQRHLYHHRKKNGDPLSFRGQHAQLVPVRSFFKWLARQNYILYNPASEMELPKLEKRLPKHVLSSGEAEAVLALPDIREPIGIRDRAMLETFYSTGMRRAELIGLKLFDLDFDRGTLMIRQGKGKKDRMVPIGERALLWIRKYLDNVRVSLCIEPDNGVLFLTAEGDAFSTYRMTQLVRDYVNASNIGKKGACHLFRHTCATLMLEGGADIRFIQQLLGHAELSTTEIYTQVSIRKLKEIHNATHPGAKLEPHEHTENPEEPDEKKRKDPPEEPPARAVPAA
jgi:integrase/recombinase XerD